MLHVYVHVQAHVLYVCKHVLRQNSNISVSEHLILNSSNILTLIIYLIYLLGILIILRRFLEPNLGPKYLFHGSICFWQTQDETRISLI